MLRAAPHDNGGLPHDDDDAGEEDYMCDFDDCDDGAGEKDYIYEYGDCDDGGAAAEEPRRHRTTPRRRAPGSRAVEVPRSNRGGRLCPSSHI
jgi:hypothetical protein